MNLQMVLARKTRRLTQAQLAKKIGCYRAGIALIELHDWVPPLKVRLAIAAVLRTPADALFAEAIRNLET